MEDMTEHYNDHHCHSCGEDLFQLDGAWLCPECDDVDSFQLVNERDEFTL